MPLQMNSRHQEVYSNKRRRNAAVFNSGLTIVKVESFHTETNQHETVFQNFVCQTESNPTKQQKR